MRALERSAKAGEPGAKEQLERLRARAGLHETLAEVEAELGRLRDAQRAAHDGFVEEGERELERYLDALFAEEPGLRTLVIRGYTPGFLDGDLCEHSQSVLIRDVAEEAAEAAEGAPPNDVPAERARVHEHHLGEFEPVLHALHDTDWQVVYTRGPDGRRVTGPRTSWSCGY